MEIFREHIRSVWHDRDGGTGQCPKEDEDQQAKWQNRLPLPLDLPLEECNKAVQHNAEAIMVAEKVKQISILFDTPQHVAICPPL